MNEIKEKAKQTRHNNNAKITIAIENLLSTEWQSYSEFANKVRQFIGKDLEWLDISSDLAKWIEQRTIRTKLKNKKATKVIRESIVEWKYPHTNKVMLRLKRAI